MISFSVIVTSCCFRTLSKVFFFTAELKLPLAFQVADEHIRQFLILLLTYSSYNLFLKEGCCCWVQYPIFFFAIYSLSSYGRRRTLRMLWRDMRCLNRLVKVFRFLMKLKKDESTIPKMFKETCEKHPEKVMFYFEDQAWTFKKVDEYSNKIANLFRSKGMKQGDTVALFMETRIEYVPIWLGLHKIGVASALINSNLTGSPLTHSLLTVPIKAIIYGAEMEPALEDIDTTLGEIPRYIFEDGDKKSSNKGAINLTAELDEASSAAPPKTNIKQSSTAFYVFTSGTTGMPKAALISHARYLCTVQAGFIYTKMKKDDSIYVPLPLYHTNGCLVGVGHSIMSGLTVALRKKFSVSNFWKDCIRYNCTVRTEMTEIVGRSKQNDRRGKIPIFIYIGETCRYLLAAPLKPEDRQHNVRLMMGNGLRPLVWEKFLNRFGIQEVAEFYGSSEGIGVLMNTEGKVGAVGHTPLLWPNLVPIYLVKCDSETELPIRDSKGRCIRITEPGVPGMHISKIITNRLGQNFEGYVDKSATNKKMIKDVFEVGDLYYVSGDVFTLDEEQFWYFQDRTGDTFRWRGENVSTTEVEQVISDILELKDAAVYGVEIPEIEGKAGMAAIISQDVDLSHLNRELSKRLPKYAKPLFLRFLHEIQLTGTYKMKKKLLKEEAFNPYIVADKMYYFSAKDDKYLELTTAIYEKILKGDIKF